MVNTSTVYLIAAEVFRARNAASAPDKHRAEIRAALRGNPYPGKRGPLRMALLDAHQARECFRHGAMEAGAAKLMLARHWMSKATVLYGEIMAGKYRQSKVEQASAPRKLIHNVEDFIRKRHKELCAAGNQYGAIKLIQRELEDGAHELKLSRPTISKAIKAVPKKNSK